MLCFWMFWDYFIKFQIPIVNIDHDLGVVGNEIFTSERIQLVLVLANKKLSWGSCKGIGLIRNIPYEKYTALVTYD